jgi:acetyl esterase/lipase
MALNPQVKQFLETLESLDVPPFESMGVAEARAAAAASAELIGPPLPVAEIRDLAVSGLGGEIRVRLYRPEGDAACPALVYLHGGGWVLGDIPTHEKLCTEIVEGAGCAVVSVDYRLAPEHKFPAAAEDAFSAVQWVMSQAEQIGIDSHRVAVGGDSAGGNLATVACLMAKDRCAKMPVGQILVYPITDCDFDTPSYHENAEGYLLTRATMGWFWDCYVGSDEDMLHPYASPLRAEDLSGLPPALVITAEYDPLRDEAETYARRLQEAGVPVALTRYDGMIHAFIRRTDLFDQAHAAQREVCHTLREVFGTNG